MSKRKKTDSFWLSYSDLMTSLFFIMLVLFIVCIVVMKSAPDDVSTLKDRIAQLEQEKTTLEKALNESTKKISGLEKSIQDFAVKQEEYEKLLNLTNTFKSLSDNSSLRYDETHKTFIAKDFEGIEIFEPNESVIKQTYLSTVDKVGKDLQKLLKELDKTDSPERSRSISYLLVIEGNTANSWDHKFNVNDQASYILSYRRAMALYKRWLDKGINLRQYNTEIQICGSGMNGINRDKKNEENNKRFVIQIIPKISRSDQ